MPSITKVCTGCRQDKPASDFWVRRGTSLQARCKECQKSRAKTYYENNKSAFIQRAKTRNAWSKVEFRAFMDGLKSGSCSDCGRKFPPCVMDFDHRDPSTKKSGVAALFWTRSREAVLAEVAKCDLVCANCHRIRTHMKRPGPLGGVRSAKP